MEKALEQFDFLADRFPEQQQSIAKERARDRSSERGAETEKSEEYFQIH